MLAFHSNPFPFWYFCLYLKINHPIYEARSITYHLFYFFFSLFILYILTSHTIHQGRNIINLISYFCFYFLFPIFYLLSSIFLSVIRFTREEILALRKVSKVLSSMTEFPDIISVTSLGPETLRPLEQDEVSATVWCGVVWCCVVMCLDCVDIYWSSAVCFLYDVRLLADWGS